MVNERVLELSVNVSAMTVDPAAMVTSRSVAAVEGEGAAGPGVVECAADESAKRDVTLEPSSERIVALLVKVAPAEPSKVSLPPFAARIRPLLV